MSQHYTCLLVEPAIAGASDRASTARVDTAPATSAFWKSAAERAIKQQQ
jgi:hypothetical protein